MVLLLTVLHHIILANGLDWTRTALERLLDNKITIIAELAKKDEDVPFEWKDRLPIDALEVFGDRSYRAIEIGQFTALNGKAIRPLYCVQQNVVKYVPGSADTSNSTRGDRPENLTHESIMFSGVDNAAVPEKQYLMSDDKFGKIFRSRATCNSSRLAEALSNELSVGRHLASLGIAPRVLGTFSTESCSGIVYEKVKGEDLTIFIAKSDISSRRRCAVNIAKNYALMQKIGIYWNDCRHHNILIGAEEQPFFVDFELSSAAELEENRRRFLWIMSHLCHSEHGGVTPEAALPTSNLSPVPDARTEPCPEWFHIISCLDEAGSFSPMDVNGFDLTDEFSSSASPKLQRSGTRTTRIELATKPTFKSPPVADSGATVPPKTVEQVRIAPQRSQGTFPAARGDAHLQGGGWVRALYRVLLEREPDPPGLAGHVQALQAGRKPEDLIGGFLKSREFAAKYYKFAKAYGQSSHLVSAIPGEGDPESDK